MGDVVAKERAVDRVVHPRRAEQREERGLEWDECGIGHDLLVGLVPIAVGLGQGERRFGPVDQGVDSRVVIAAGVGAVREAEGAVEEGGRIARPLRGPYQSGPQPIEWVKSHAPVFRSSADAP